LTISHEKPITLSYKWVFTILLFPLNSREI